MARKFEREVGKFSGEGVKSCGEIDFGWLTEQ